MEKSFYMITLISLCVITTVHTQLQCYVCSSCPHPDVNTDVKTCEATTTTTTTTTTTPVTATEVPVTNSPATGAPDGSTTEVPATGAPDGSTTEVPATGAPDGSTTEVPATGAPNGSTTEVPATGAPDGSTTEAPVTNAPDGSTTTEGQFQVPAERRKRFVEDESISNKGCVCYHGKCDCSGNYEPKSSGVQWKAASFQCYSYTYTNNGTEVVDRGCKEIPDGSAETACSLLGATAGCKYCDTDKCNSAFNIKFSIALLICTIFMSML